MAGKFVIAKETKPEVLDWGKLGWLSNPPNDRREAADRDRREPRRPARGTIFTSTPTRRR